MDGYSISQVAERTGFSASALRFYEQSGLVRPDRTPAGYRSYDEHDVAQLRFIGRAKGFGLSLDEITEVLPLLDAEPCASVQHRLRDLVDTKITAAQTKVAELVAFTAELQRAAASLRGPAADGPCDDTCACRTDQVRDGDQSAAERASVALTAKASRTAGADDAPIACSLSPDRIPGRVADWQSILAPALDRHPIDGGVRVRLPAGTDLAAVATLAAAEQDCCRFFTFTLTIGTDGVDLDVTGPDDARPVIDALVGSAASAKLRS